MPNLQNGGRGTVTVNAARNEVLHLIYNGKDKILNSGLAKGNAVQAQRTTAKVTAVAGFYGEPYYYESGDDSAKVTINVKDGSETDNILQALYNDQFDDSNNLVSTFDLKIEQKDKHKVTTLTDCLIANEPNQDMNDADHSMAWSLLAGKMTTISQKPNDNDFPWSDSTSANGGGALPDSTPSSNKSGN
ncbi:DUF3277 family protein (plasmid) [Fructilactobacillus ixorae]|uniref:DUF3277 family protein n=1 Tax=Fructilactobacillus ixorae TaxID=1750535 RepID=A0ABY5C9L8_9LACO|nr:phage protein [Fructilactobacillus ixorae]USS94006.1 DUF3277 family protein [Fructilactobacillus ixorae]